MEPERRDRVHGCGDARLNGVDTARKMRETAPDAVLMFVTNLAQYAIAGYEVNALDFVLKPVNYFSFKLKITRALEAAQKNHGSILQVNTDHGTEYIKATEVWYIEVQSMICCTTPRTGC